MILGKKQRAEVLEAIMRVRRECDTLYSLLASIKDKRLETTSTTLISMQAWTNDAIIAMGNVEDELDG